MSWLPGEQLTRLLVAPPPFRRQMPRAKHGGPARAHVLGENNVLGTTLVQGRSRGEDSIRCDSLGLSSPGTRVRTHVQA